jgi:UDP-N-acetylglucosamine:LPS N-acetylglucosamine transferase
MLSVLWIGTEKGIEKKIIDKTNIPIEYINFSGIEEKDYLQYIKLTVLKIKIATIQAENIDKKI